MNINLVSITPNSEQAAELAHQILINLGNDNTTIDTGPLIESILQSQNWATIGNSGSATTLVRFSVKKEEIYLFDVHVFEKKNAGTGAALIGLIKQLAKLLGKRYIRLRCKVDSRACAFYRRLGFEEQGREADLLRFQFEVCRENGSE